MARIVIVGAGVGGLCAAHAVADAGHEPVVLERANGATSVGAGLALWPNAVLALDRLGLGEAVRAVAATARRAVIRSPRGSQLTAVDVAAIGQRAGAPMLLVERSDLHRVLGAGVPVQLDTNVTEVADGAVKLVCGGEIAADAVIGADGINSTVRASIAPGSTPRDAGFTAIRGVADHAIEDGTAFEVWGRRELIGAAALANGRTYWFFEAPRAAVDVDDPVGSMQPSRWSDPFAVLVAATDPASLLVNRIRTLPRLDDWTRGTTALLGDAAHAMAPNLGQGAAQSIEDAAALGDALRCHDDLPHALSEYARARQRRARRIQRESGRAARLALSPIPLLRNPAVRIVPDWLRVRVIERLLLA